MGSYIKEEKKSLKQRFKELPAICHEAANALGISEGEFWVWYGSPFILQNRGVINHE